MRKLFLSLGVLAGAVLSSAMPASANAAAGLVQKPAISSDVQVEKIHWRHGHRRHLGFGIGFGNPYYYGYYPRYRYYSNSDYGYYPRYRHRQHHHRHNRLCRHDW